MLIEFLSHLRYFMPRLLGFGLALGAVFGALTYPLLGAIAGAPWGLAAGFIMAFVLSIFLPIYERRFASEDSADYQSQVSIAAGLVTTVVMALPLLVIFAPVAGLTAAYLMHNYAESAEYRGEKRKSFMPDAYQRRGGALSKMAGETLGTGKWVVFLGSFAVTIFFLFANFWGNLVIFSLSDFVAALFLLLTGMMYGFMASLPVALVNGLFVHFMNRLYFKPDTPKEQYKARIVPMVAILTLFSSAIVTFGLGAPFASIAAGLAASKYADWYYEEAGAEKPKRAARLEDEQDDAEAFADEAEDDARQDRVG